VTKAIPAASFGLPLVAVSRSSSPGARLTAGFVGNEHRRPGASCLSPKASGDFRTATRNLGRVLAETSIPLQLERLPGTRL